MTERISRYLLMVAMLNGGFAIMLGLGLFALQVPYAFLWGFLAGSLRFIPYIGPWIGAMGPIGIALATSAGWSQPMAVFGLVLGGAADVPVEVLARAKALDEARSAKDFAAADAIRAELQAGGWTVETSKVGTVVRR